MPPRVRQASGHPGAARRKCQSHRSRRLDGNGRWLGGPATVKKKCHATRACVPAILA